jgi:cell division protein FtsB
MVAMNVIFNIKYRISKAVIPFISLFLIVYFVFHLLQGQRGLNVYLKLDEDLLKANQELAVLENKKQHLDERVSLLHPQHLDSDMADEQIRLTLGYIHEDEKVILLPRHKGDYANAPSVILIPEKSH